MAKKKKPAPISMKLSKRPAARPAAPDEPLEPFNAVSDITAKQMARAERAIDNLRKEVKEISNRPPPKVSVKAPTSQVVIPPRARIAKVVIKYDQLGFPTELLPQYTEPV